MMQRYAAYLEGVFEVEDSDAETAPDIPGTNDLLLQ